jgi:hypothetical protein
VTDGATCPSDSDLFGRDVVHTSGVRMGRIEVVVHCDGDARMAVVRRGRLARRWYCVSLNGARLVGGIVVVSADYGRERPAPGDAGDRQAAESVS